MARERCSRCGAAAARLNIHRGEVLCDRCYEQAGGEEGEICLH